MELNIWLGFVSAVLILMSTPGPSQLLMLSNSTSDGFRRSVFTAAGDLSANFIQMAIASVGLVSLIQNSSEFFMAVKWGGVFYLIFLGLKLMFSSPIHGSQLSKNRRSIRSLYLQGFITSAANPKAVVFFAALFPQFITPSEPLFIQFVILSATYLTIDGMFLCFYGNFAEWVSKNLLHSGRKHLNRVSGAFLIVAAILLGLKDIDPK